MYRVSGQTFSLHDRKVLMDTYNRPILEISKVKSIEIELSNDVHIKRLLSRNGPQFEIPGTYMLVHILMREE